MVEVKILWSDRSIIDLEETISFISHDSPAVAKNFVTKIIDAVTVLETFPSIGRIVPEYNDPNLREILYRNYRIVSCAKTQPDLCMCLQPRNLTDRWGAIMWDTMQQFDGSHSQVQIPELWYSPRHEGPPTTHHPPCSKLDQQRSAVDH